MKSKLAILAALAAVTVTASAAPKVQITEVMYTGLFGEFVEVTNIAAPAAGGVNDEDISGWTFRDSGNTLPNDEVEIAPAGTPFPLEPGQAIIVTEISAFVFDIVWYQQPTTGSPNPGNLVFVENNIVNLGRADAARIFSDTDKVNPVTGVTYSDPSNGPRSEDVSMIPNNLTTIAANSQGVNWKLSTLDPAAWKAGSPAPANGPFGSPGYYTTP